jgi:hypothetical protein
MRLNQREVNTVLVALRRYQHFLDGTTPDRQDEQMLRDIADNGGEQGPLTSAKVDVLCLKLNVVERTRLVYVRFHGQSYQVKFARYAGTDRVVVRLQRDYDPADYLTATVNVPEWHAGEGEVLIKDYSENEGILAVLTAARVVADTGRTYPVGMTSVNICRLLIDPELYGDA